jgi:membrane protein required for beta-lactamase induction
MIHKSIGQKQWIKSGLNNFINVKNRSLYIRLLIDAIRCLVYVSLLTALDNVKFEVFTTVLRKTQVLRIVTLCRWVGNHCLVRHNKRRLAL